MAAASDNIPTPSTIDPWTIFRTTQFTDHHGWFSDGFGHESDAITQALIHASSAETNISTKVSKKSNRRVDGVTPTETRKKKRKSRASKKTPTTFIATDAASFRMMVQQVTGARFPVGCGTTSSSWGTVSRVLKPEPQRQVLGLGRVDQGCLPTLDTSAFYLVDVQQHQALGGGGFDGTASVAAAAEEEAVGFVPATEEEGDCGAVFDFDAFEVVGGGFPTLEPWKAMT